MPVVVSGESLLTVDPGAPAPIVVSQANSLQAVVADDEVALVEGETNIPLALGKTDIAVVTLETAVVA